MGRGWKFHFPICSIIFPYQGILANKKFPTFGRPESEVRRKISIWYLTSSLHISWGNRWLHIDETYIVKISPKMGVVCTCRLFTVICGIIIWILGHRQCSDRQGPKECLSSPLRLTTLSSHTRSQATGKRSNLALLFKEKITISEVYTYCKCRLPLQKSAK